MRACGGFNIIKFHMWLAQKPHLLLHSTRFSLFQKWLCLCCCSWCVYGFMLLPHSAAAAAAICGLPLKGKYHKWENCSLPFITTETHTQTQLWCENLCWCWKVFFAVPFWVLINVGAGCNEALKWTKRGARDDDMIVVDYGCSNWFHWALNRARNFVEGKIPKFHSVLCINTEEWQYTLQFVINQLFCN